MITFVSLSSVTVDLCGAGLRLSEIIILRLRVELVNFIFYSRTRFGNDGRYVWKRGALLCPQIAYYDEVTHLKETKMSLEAERQFLCPRLIDYLAIVGVRPTNNMKPSTTPSIQVSIGFT